MKPGESGKPQFGGRVLFIVAAIVLLAGVCAFRTQPPSSDPAPGNPVPEDPVSLGIHPAHLDFIGEAVRAAVQRGELPGAVVVVGRRAGIAYCRAFGNRSVEPAVEPMTVDTIFDMSSLTKVMATTPAILMLVESGRLRLDDRVSRYLPAFAGDGKESITVRQLLTHYSGLRPSFDLSRDWFGYQEALRELWAIKPDSEPGKAFAYSDLNFIALGELVRTISGRELDVFARERIFEPLGMADTGFRPSQSLIPRIAPTEPRKDTLRYQGGKALLPSMETMIRGEVHDPTAWRMEGVAGHAGVFSSARDLAVYARTLLSDGAYPGGRLLSARTVQAMSRPQSPEGASQVRGFGWDIASDYASPRGDLLTGGYGHSGFTGTSLWIHPQADLFIAILSNRVHPRGGKNINHLRSVVANIAVSAIADSR